MAEKPPSTPEMDARQAEEMVNSMMLNSPLLDPERSEGKLPEDDGSKKLNAQVTLGSVLPQEKLKLAYKLLGVNS